MALDSLRPHLFAVQPLHDHVCGVLKERSIYFNTLFYNNVGYCSILNNNRCVQFPEYLNDSTILLLYTGLWVLARCLICRAKDVEKRCFYEVQDYE
jgi:hypothetical protein